MAATLGRHYAASAGTYEVYEVPAGKYAKVNISVVATKALSRVHLYIANDATPVDEDRIQYDVLTTSRYGYERTAIILSAGERVFYETDVDGVTVQVHGNTYDASSSPIVQGVMDRTEISANGTYELYQVPASMFAVANLSVTLDDTANSTAQVSVYIDDNSSADNIDLFQKEMLTITSKTGFERGGFAMNAQAKVYLVVSGLTGKLSARLHGFVRNA